MNMLHTNIKTINQHVILVLTQLLLQDLIVFIY
jgi:hypothetical protein